MDEIEDGKVTIIGPDIKEMKEGGVYPLGILVEAAGAKIDQGLEGVIERRIHGYMNFIEGFMHLNQRYDIWMRLSKNLSRKDSIALITSAKSCTDCSRANFRLSRKCNNFHHRPSQSLCALPRRDASV